MDIIKLIGIVIFGAIALGIGELQMRIWDRKVQDAQLRKDNRTWKRWTK